jgi:hypothetical protein
MKKSIIPAAVFLTLGLALAPGRLFAEDLIVATTSWSAAFVEAAAPAGKVVYISPAELRHPPEYEFKPADAYLLGQSRYFVFAGYEAMVPRIKGGSLKVSGEHIQIATVNTSAVIRASVMKLAKIFGTEAEAEKNVARIEAFFEEWKREIAAAGWKGSPVVCHAFLADLAKELGFTVAGVYGPGPLEAARIVGLSETKPRFILDNWHTDAGKPLVKALPGVPVAGFINFPGPGNTKTLLNVLTYNRKELKRLMN